MYKPAEGDVVVDRRDRRQSRKANPRSFTDQRPGAPDNHQRGLRKISGYNAGSRLSKEAQPAELTVNSNTTTIMPFPTITEIKTFVVPGEGEGGDYHSQKAGHWIIGQISNPMSRYEQYKMSRVSWGINVLGSFCVQITASDGTTGFATGMGGPPSCWLVEQHLKRFLQGADPRDTSLLSDQMLRASMYYGRKGLVVATISVVDLALWDLVGKIRKEPVYKMIGGRTRDYLSFYCTGPLPAEAKRLGFWGGKVPLTWGPADGQEGMRKNYEELKKHRESGPDFPIMVDCYMSLTVRPA
ncbi:hypothetical protein FRC12_013084 [Ceratobasidium sp. 428]|nr:hypothetical protein FRC12_013084 [Ceratobasidium sp. 428]